MSAIDDKQREIPWVGAAVDAGGGSGEMVLPGGGSCRDFENASIYWTPATGAHEIHGEIRVHFSRIGGLRTFGYPTTDESGCPDGVGRYNHFERGSIYWTPTTGAHEVHGAIRDRWAHDGWERGPLRYPVSDESDMPGGRVSRFQGGAITWTPAGGAKVAGNID